MNFRAHKIASSLAQFSHACTLLPSDVVSQVSDAIASASTSNTPYEDLKKAVLARLESSVSARLQALLSKEELGNEKLSDLLRRMKRLLGDKFDSFDRTLFTHLFYQRLPPALQRNLFSVKDKLSLNDLAQLADDYMASTPAEHPPSVATVSSTSDTQQLVHLITQLTLKVNSLEERLSDTQRYHPPPHRSRSPRPYRRSRSGSRGSRSRTPQSFRERRNKVHQTLLLQRSTVKPDRRMLMAHNIRPITSKLLHIHDRLTGFNFLVDTGAEVSVLPATQTQKLLTLPLTSTQPTTPGSLSSSGRR